MTVASKNSRVAPQGVEHCGDWMVENGEVQKSEMGAQGLKKNAIYHREKAMGLCTIKTQWMLIMG